MSCCAFVEILLISSWIEFWNRNFQRLRKLDQFKVRYPADPSFDSSDDPPRHIPSRELAGYSQIILRHSFVGANPHHLRANDIARGFH